MNNLLIQDSQKKFLNALLSGNHIVCSEIAHHLLDEKITINELYENILKRALYDVGELWEYNKISVATEHLASAIVEAILNELYFNIISKEKINKEAIFSCVEDEFHQIGIKMISDIFEINGWSAHFLGSNTPTSDLISYLKLVRPDILAISLSIYFHLPKLEQMIQLVKNDFPNQLILVGGQAFRYGGQEVISKYENVIYLSDIDSTEKFIKNLN